MKRIAVTGASGQIAYSLLFRLASGEVFGNEPIVLSLCDLPEMMSSMEGLVMELEDCAFPAVQEIRYGTDPFSMFERADYALLLGSKPRAPGMERGDLLRENGKIFVKQGQALEKTACRNVKVLVVGNPCNTNCLIAMHHAPSLKRKNFHALMRLDQNRATALLAKKAKCMNGDVTNLIVWGNHSATQVPDFNHVKINQKPLNQVIGDQDWLQQDFMEIIRQRGAAVLKARGKSSAASAAQGVIDAMKSLAFPTQEGDWFSSAVFSENNPYGIDEGLIFGFPCQSKGDGEYEIVPGLHLDHFIREKIAVTQEELLKEKALVQEWL